MRKTDYAAIGETLYTAVLPNGLSVYVIPKPGYRRSFAMFAANYGGADRRFSLGGCAQDTPAGVAHYLEHKMFDTPEGDALLRLGATGADVNAFTSEAMTAYHFEGTGHFEENLRTLLSFVSVPYFTQESVDRERGIIAQEIRMYEDSPDYALFDSLMKQLFRTHPLRDNVAGSVESIAEITPELLYACHRVFYHPSNMALCVVGDVPPEKVEQIARETLPPETAELPLRDYGPEEGPAPAESLHTARMEVASPLFMIGAKLGPAPAGEAALLERITAGLALRCLCGHSSPFYMRNYREGLLNASFGTDTNFAAGQGIVFFEGETVRDPREVFDALCGEILRVGSDGFDPALFARQKKASLGGRIRALNNFQGLAAGLAEGAFTGYCPLDSFRLMEGVTCEDASAWIRSKLDPARFAMSVVCPEEA